MSYYSYTSSGYFSGLPLPLSPQSQPQKISINTNDLLNNIDHYIMDARYTFIEKNENDIKTAINSATPKQFIYDPSYSSSLYIQHTSGYPKLDYLKLLNYLNAWVLRVSEINGKVNCIYTNDNIEIPGDILPVLKKLKRGEINLTDSDNAQLTKFQTIVNEEHIIPSSVYLKFTPPIFDLHNVFACRTIVNIYRQNFQFTNDIPVGKSDMMLCVNSGNYYFLDRDLQQNLSLKKDPLISPSKCCSFQRQSPKGFCINPTPKEMTKCNEWSSKLSDELISDIEEKQKSLQSLSEEKFEIPKLIGCRFGSCLFSPAHTPNRGTIARSVLYFHLMYANNPAINEYFPSDFFLDRFKELYFGNKKIYGFMNDNLLRLMAKWYLQYPPTESENVRARRIYEIQGNINPFWGRIKPFTKEIQTYTDIVDRYNMLQRTFFNFNFVLVK